MHTFRMNWIMGLTALAAFCAGAETLTFTPKVNNSGHWTWANMENWLTASGGNKAPAEGDDLLIDTPANNFHAANAATYVKGIRFTKNAIPYSGISWNGFYLKAGGEGLKVEHTQAKSAYSTLNLDGDVTIDLAGDYWWQGGVVGRTATNKSRVTKLGTAKLSLEMVKDNWTGATIREGSLYLKTDSGKSGIDFHFDGSAASAKLILGGNLVLKDGGLSSTADLPLTDHGVYDSSAVRTLTLSGVPKSTSMYFAGGFHQTTSFVYAPDVPGCTFTAARAMSTTTGGLTISNGTFRVAEGASFPSLVQLFVKEGGALSIAADAGAVTPAYFELQGGVVDVDAGTVWELPKVIRAGAAVADGDYTAANCDWVTGEGTVRINHRKNYVDPIYLDAASGATVTLAEALTAYNTAHEGEAVSVETLNGGADAGRTLVKTGTGVLRMDTPIANFTGMVHVEAGVLKSEVRYSIGKESNANAPVYVYSGATFSSMTTNAYMNTGRTFHIEGTGASGYQGALHCGSDGVPNNYHLYNVFGSKVILEGDASARVGAWIEVASSLTLNGHTLTVIGNNTTYNDTPIHIRTVNDNGHIVVQNAEWRDEPRVTFNGTDPNNSVTMKNRGGFRFASNSQAFDGAGMNAWKLKFEGPDSVFYTDYHVSTRDSGSNRLTVPTVLDTVVSLIYQGDRRRGSIFVNAPLSGTGGLKTEGGRNVFLHLFNPNNTFTGGIRIDHGVVWAYPNGAIPLDGSITLASASATYNVTGQSDGNKNFQNYFDGIAFMQSDTYSLPELVATGTFPVRVQNGQGAWKKVTQNGSGALEYYSELGASLLEVKKGTVKLPRGAQAGLWEGTNMYSSASAAKTAYEGTDVSRHLAVRGPTSALQMEGYNYTTWKARECITYTGYIWNRGATDVTWTLASALANGAVTVKIDGNHVLTAAASTLTAANVTLTPGAHAFEYRAYAGDAAASPYAPAGWAGKFGFVYDVQGRNDTSSTNNFERCVDTGDGALFTRTADTAAHLPSFDEMKFAPGTSLDVNGNAYTAKKVRGWATVTSSAVDASANPSFAIAEKLVVDGADLAADRTLVVDMPFSFGTDGGILATNLAIATHGRYTIARTTDAAGINFGSEGFARTRYQTDDKNWLVSTSADGKELILEYSAGTVFIFR